MLTQLLDAIHSDWLDPILQMLGTLPELAKLSRVSKKLHDKVHSRGHVYQLTIDLPINYPKKIAQTKLNFSDNDNRTHTKLLDNVKEIIFDTRVVPKTSFYHKWMHSAESVKFIRCYELKWDKRYWFYNLKHLYVHNFDVREAFARVPLPLALESLTLHNTSLHPNRCLDMLKFIQRAHNLQKLVLDTYSIPDSDDLVEAQCKSVQLEFAKLKQLTMSQNLVQANSCIGKAIINASSTNSLSVRITRDYNCAFWTPQLLNKCNSIAMRYNNENVNRLLNVQKARMLHNPDALPINVVCKVMAQDAQKAFELAHVRTPGIKHFHFDVHVPITPFSTITASKISPTRFFNPGTKYSVKYVLGIFVAQNGKLESFAVNVLRLWKTISSSTAYHFNKFEMLLDICDQGLPCYSSRLRWIRKHSQTNDTQYPITIRRRLAEKCI